MRAVRVTAFGAAPELVELPDPVPAPDGVVVRVEATGLCASDRFAWLGHDDGVTLPFVPGHELAGRVVATGPDVRRIRIGDRVTTPFVCGCGDCPQCRDGRSQVCPRQQQPGFTHDGSFAELVALRHADHNLVPLPDGTDAGGAALLGCRVATAYRALTGRGGVRPGDTVLVIGAGGVGLAAVLVAATLGAEVVVADPAPAARARAAELGAAGTLDPAEGPERVRELIGDGGARVAVESAGRAEALAFGIRALRPHGVLVQVGLLTAEPVVPVPEMIAKELVLAGSHGMAAADYPALVELVDSGRLDPARLVTRRIPLPDAPAALAAPPEPGSLTVVLP
ncbi:MULTISPECIES: alcohol dehydrogenase catalytic domain-containing protein [Pseudonocardia]|uniref:D-arabitol-phosphate dehydrogenase n=2 Tax=Pseudonocardia TaxID=1847 RepID=A0A1Y2N616_PSEAH|nr:MULTISPECIES: alcohol dehydrogenase catalytic domain-containing protein [Pseudonocardia]OSY42896.1 D-arabitol-phosphate dehydrogenase [Pseudonocardia autotrophica]TDN77474.1 alcohol dehydrogenase [Pseudonocardia autotrophica]BBG01496.1 alcohol dehydrogenase [Pseudonocardia autotrophica]GEC25280.1 alcohol dehydrogenase [Pseudonocardia saturnea]